MPHPSHPVVQRDWLEMEGRPTVKQWSILRQGLRWFYEEQTGMMYYALEDPKGIPIKAQAKLREIAGQKWPYEQWIAAGWVEKEDGEAPAPQVEKTLTDAPKPPKTFSGPTSGVEVENPAQFSLLLDRTRDQGVIAKVVHTESNETLAEFTTDMGKNPYTIENRTSPVVETDAEGLKARREALALLTQAIKEAGTGSVLPPATSTKRFADCIGKAIEAKTSGTLRIEIKQPAHKVVSTGGAKRPGLQVTKGVPLSALISDAPKLQGVFSETGNWWMKEYKGYADSFLKDHKDRGKAAAVFGILASLIHFYLVRIDVAAKKRAIEGRMDYDAMGEKGVGGKGVEGENVSRPDLVDPNEKNAWGLLPKTPPGEWLDAIEDEDKGLVKRELRAVGEAGEVNKKAWNEILGDVLGNKMIAGHAVPKFKIGEEPGLAFEIRSPGPEERKPYGY
jgi:hypothetical protein